MSNSATMNIAGLAVPKVNAASLMTILLAGAMATIAFDFFGQSLSPMLGFSKLAPVPLANGVISVVFGAPYSPGAHFLHYMAGMIAYPVGWMFIAKPIADKVMPGLPWLLSSAVYGVVLWVFALYIMAHLIAGNPPFLGFTGITWVALVGHVVFAIVAAWIVRWRRGS